MHNNNNNKIYKVLQYYAEFPYVLALCEASLNVVLYNNIIMQSGAAALRREGLSRPRLAPPPPATHQVLLGRRRRFARVGRGCRFIALATTVFP